VNFDSDVQDVTMQTKQSPEPPSAGNVAEERGRVVTAAEASALSIAISNFKLNLFRAIGTLGVLLLLTESSGAAGDEAVPV
jgi:hypothetical protein